MNIGNVINNYIKQEKITKADLAKQLGVTPQSLSNYLHSGRNIGWKTVEQIMNILGYDIVFRRITEDSSRLQKNPIYDLPNATQLTDEDLNILRNLAIELIAKNQKEVVDGHSR